MPVAQPTLPSQPSAPSPPPPGSQPSSTPGGTGGLDARIDRLETRLDFLHNYTAYPITTEPGVTLSSTSNVIMGGITIPWSILRPILQLPDDRWDAWASGWLGPATG